MTHKIGTAEMKGTLLQIYDLRGLYRTEQAFVLQRVDTAAELQQACKHVFGKNILIKFTQGDALYKGSFDIYQKGESNHGRKKAG